MKQRFLKTIAALTLSAAILLPADLPAVSPTAYAAEEHIYGIDGDHAHDECSHEEVIPTGTTVLSLKQYAASAVAAPTASKKSGNIFYCDSDSTSISLSAESGATIYYSLNGGKYKKYSSEVKLTKNSTVKAYAKKNGKKSETATFKYTLKPSTSAVKFKITDVKGGKLVKITSKISDLKIYYTTDGSTPTTKSKAYTSDGIKLTKSGNFRFLVTKSGWGEDTFRRMIPVAGSTGNSSVSSELSKFISKGTETRKCKVCVDGKCQRCNGKGTTTDKRTCDECNGSGKCTVCGGTEKVTVKVNVIKESAVPSGKTFDKCAVCEGAGICKLCNGMKIRFGSWCTSCGDSGECSHCNGDGGELKNKSGSSSSSSSSKSSSSGSSSSKSSSSSSSSGNSGSSSSSSKVVTKGTETRDCKACYIGNCIECNGMGTISRYPLGKIDCSRCKGTGKCYICNGTREIKVKVNVVNEDAVPKGKEFRKCGQCQASGVCPYCNGGKVQFGTKCSSCKGSGICATCDGSGGKLIDKPAPSTGSSSSGSSSSGNTGGGTTITVPNAPVGGTAKCAVCKGSGICSVCDGTGQIWGWKKKVTCTNCHGTRRCPFCKNGIVSY